MDSSATTSVTPQVPEVLKISSSSGSSDYIEPISNTVAEVLQIFSDLGSSSYIGEPVSSTEHALQAAYLAKLANQPDEIIAGALLHDLGHLIGLSAPDKYERMGHCGTMAHEGIGAAFLEQRGFPKDTVALVRKHVDAKRYLTWKDKSYFDRLSDASKTTLGYQGGPMSSEEAAKFEVDPMSSVILLMRTWDEAAKIPGRDVPSLLSYAPMLEALIVKNKSL